MLKQEPELLKAIGIVIVERRHALSMTQQELADAVGVQRTYLSEIEQGKRNMAVSTLHHLAESLGTSSANLLKRADSVFKKLVDRRLDA